MGGRPVPDLDTRTRYPKSSDPQRQRANLDIFRFSLSDAELAALATLDRGEDAAVDSDLRVEF